MGLPWWPSGKDSTLPRQGAQVRSLVGELRSHMLNGAAKTTNQPSTTLKSKHKPLTMTCKALLIPADLYGFTPPPPPPPITSGLLFFRHYLLFLKYAKHSLAQGSLLCLFSVVAHSSLHSLVFLTPPLHSCLCSNVTPLCGLP